MKVYKKIDKEIKGSEFPSKDFCDNVRKLPASFIEQTYFNLFQAPLHWAALRGKVDFVKILLDAGFDPNAMWGPLGCSNYWQESVLHCAAGSSSKLRGPGSPEIIKMLFDASAKDLNVKTKKAYDPLSIFSSWKGPVVTPLDVAVMRGNKEIIETLLELGADPTEVIKNRESNKEKFPQDDEILHILKTFRSNR